MIPYNGHIRVKRSIGGGIDSEGMPVPVQSEWSEPIPCRIQTNTYSERGKYQDGNFTASSYIIFIPLIPNFNPERVEITKDNRALGEFNIQYMDILNIVGQIKISV